MNAPETFCGSVGAGNQQKASETFTECIRLLLVRTRTKRRSGHSGQRASPLLGEWARSLRESSPFRIAVTFLANIRASAAGGRCFEIPLFEWMGEECPYPFRSQMAKVEPGETVWKCEWGRSMTYAPEHEKELLNRSI
jgi:hypothetical protein